MEINIDKYAIKDVNRHRAKSPKTQIIIANSLRKDNHHILRLQHKEFGKTKKWNTFTISRDGLIYQHYDPNYHSDFIGIKEIDKQSISIVLENMGYLVKLSSGKYVNWLNEECDEEYVVNKNWYGYSYWESIPNIQLLSAVDLVKKLCDDFGVRRNVIEFTNYNVDMAKFRGIAFRSNYTENSTDINPAFNLNEFTNMIQNM